MQVKRSERNTYLIDWSEGRIELNLMPMNTQLGTADFRAYYGDIHREHHVITPMGDHVGIAGLTLKDSPTVPRILWDSREHQFWKGFVGPFEPRNAVVQWPSAEAVDDGAKVRAGYGYFANHVKTTFEWEFAESRNTRHKAMWDTTLRVENLTGNMLEGYLQFFASYHPHGTNCYWDVSGEIKPFVHRTSCVVRDSAEADRLGASSYGEFARQRNTGICWEEYTRPVLLSETRDCYAGCRHVIMVEPATCAAVVDAQGQARDYMIRPPGRTLKNEECFTTRVRHVITTVEGRDDMEALWVEFESAPSEH